MSQVFGSQGESISENAFTWASQLEVTMLAPHANSSGTVRLGHFTVSSLFTRDAVTSVSINDLLKAVHTTLEVKKVAKFTLQSAVVNHDIAGSLNRRVVATQVEEEIFGAEVIAFAIVEKPFTSTLGGTNVTWSTDMAVHANYMFMPKIWDSFSRSLDANNSASAIEIDKHNIKQGRKSRLTLITGARLARG